FPHFSGSVIIFSSLSSTLTLLLPTSFFHVSFATLAYTKSDLPLALSSSNLSHSSLHHVSLALAASLRISLLSCLYLFFPSSSLLFFHFLLSSILFIISLVIHGFFIH